MILQISDELILDSCRALYLPKSRSLVLADFFFGTGAARRKRPDPLPWTQLHESWERLFSLLGRHQPERIVLLGEVKPNQGSVEGDEREELQQIFRKLKGACREVVQVVGHIERAAGPATEKTGVQIVDGLRLDHFMLMHRRRIFVYPRLDGGGLWINGGLHPLFVLPLADRVPGDEPWMRIPTFLNTGYAWVLPPFISFAQGHEVMQAERMPKQAKAWGLVGDRLLPLDLPNLPVPPVSWRNLNKIRKKEREESNGNRNP